MVLNDHRVEEDTCWYEVELDLHDIDICRQPIRGTVYADVGAGRTRVYSR